MVDWSLLYTPRGSVDYVDMGDACGMTEEVYVHFWLRIGCTTTFYWSPLQEQWIDIAKKNVEDNHMKSMLLKMFLQQIDGDAITSSPLSFLIDTGYDLHKTLKGVIDA